jgi:RNA polymerase sigma-70 factor (ECF subfamily)
VSDQDWQQKVYSEKAAELLLYGRALGLSHSEAEDVLQETFLALMQLDESPAIPVHYCVRSFRNRALNYRRGWLRRIARELESSCWFDHHDAERPEELVAMRCLERLPREQREVIVLKIWHELTFDEIGALLELSANTAAGRYRYGLEKLRRCMTEKEYEELELDRGANALMAAPAAIKAG